MAIMSGLSGVAVTIDVAVATVALWVKRGLPHKRKGFKYYFDTQEVAQWLRNESNRKYGHLADKLEKYKG